MRKSNSPKVDSRLFSNLFAELKRLVPHYTPEWPASEDQGAGVALLKIYSFITEMVINRFNRTPYKNFAAFLDMLGIKLLPAIPSRVPIHFKLASGIQTEIFIRKRTQTTVDASEKRPEELHFETEANLLAIPSPLVEVISIDPEKDAIYKPPPGFLEQEIPEEIEPSYQIVSFSEAGSKAFQIDRVDGLKEEYYLKIGGDLHQQAAQTQADSFCATARLEEGAVLCEYGIISSLKGDIVTLTEPLKRNYEAGTRVEKITRFHVFEGKNHQEHVLHLGHLDLFNVKSPAQFSLIVRHLVGTDVGLDPLQISWEYWGKSTGEEGEDWRPFRVELDGTQGLSGDGRIELVKGEGEITERKIKGIGSRWIRGKLDKPLSVNSSIGLPQLERITFFVKSAGETLKPDQAFHNDTPLELPFHPFGTEPRIFDRFYIASQEVFSKKKAKVTLEITLDEKGILSAPTAIQFKGKLRVFDRGIGGRLVDIEVDPSPDNPSRVFQPHEAIGETAIALGSSVAVTSSLNQSRLYVFARGQNGRLYERFYNAIQNQWAWVPLETPPGADRIVFDPSVMLEQDNPRVFVVATKGQLRELYSVKINPNTGNQIGGWISHSKPPGAALDSSPFAVSQSGHIRVFASDQNGHVHRLDGLGQVWTALPTDSFEVGLDPRSAEKIEELKDSPGRSRPFAQLSTDGVISKVVIRDSAGNLREYDSHLNSWVNLDAPAGVILESDPFGVYEELGQPGEERYVFVRGSDNRLWERTSQIDWVSHQRPGEADLQLSPWVLRYQQQSLSYVSVFSSSSKNIIGEFRKQLNEEGTAQGGPNRTLVLDPGASADNDEYAGNFVHISSGPGQDDELRSVAHYGGADRVIVLDQSASNWDPLPDQNSTFRILSLVHQGTAQNVSETEITLEIGAAGFSEVSVEMIIQIHDGQIRPLKSAPAEDGAAKIDSWDPPQTPVGYRVFDIIHQEQVAAVTSQNIILAPECSSDDGEYKGLQIRITSGTGENQIFRIQSYSGSTRIARVGAPWSVNPDSTSTYQIIDALSSTWLQYKDPQDQELRPELSWEYWNGSGWVKLIDVKDKTGNFLVGDEIEFQLPENTEQTEVSGQENFWIRARIVGGDYGRETFDVADPNKGFKRGFSSFSSIVSDQLTELVPTKRTIQPPLIKDLKISYQLIEEQFPSCCLTFNNLDYLDQTMACKTPDKRVMPFQTLEDRNRTIYTGFENSFKGGPVKIFFAAKELDYTNEKKPKMKWAFRSENEWKPLSVDDATEGLIKQEILELLIPKGFEAVSRFGGSRYWVKGTLTEGEYEELPVLAGIFPNTTWSFQAESISEEILGSSNGEPHQTFQFFKFPVCDGEEIRIREVLSDEERRALEDSVGKKAVHEIRDEKGKLLETWVLWSEVKAFFDSDEKSRHYILDRAVGQIQFGDGRQGQIPPAGQDNIQAFSYQAGGGSAGNVEAGEIQTLSTALAGVESVINPVAAGGGSDTANMDQMLEIGPAMISHRERAVTVDDFEWLAKEASREIEKVRCLPNTNNKKQKEPGCVTVYIVPDLKTDLPMPSLELRAAVRRYLEYRCANTVASLGNIFVDGPEYVKVHVKVDVYAKSINLAAQVDIIAREKLRAFLHPLTGGPSGRGWEFGRGIAASDVYVLLEEVEGVDHVERLMFTYDEKKATDFVEISQNALVCTGTHTINVKVIDEAMSGA